MMLQKLEFQRSTVLYFDGGGVSRSECILPSVASKHQHETRKHVVIGCQR